MRKYIYSIFFIFTLIIGVYYVGCQKENDEINSSQPGLNKATPKSKMDTPAITCGNSTQTSINIQVCALTGGTGSPAGFSIQWMTKADYDQYGWLSNSDDPNNPASFCKASFSGNANLSRYNLGAGECVTVDIGEFLFDNGASTDCVNALTCGTEYVFRAFAHANSTLQRSDFTPTLICSTLDCQSNGGCTYTQGYWKTHGPVGCNPSSSENLWPLDLQNDGLTLGTVNYTQDQLCSIFNTPASGNGLIALAHQLIAAKINIANGSDPTAIASSIAAADLLIDGLIIPPVGSGSLSASAASSLVTALTNYNEGATGPGHCE